MTFMSSWQIQINPVLSWKPWCTAHFLPRFVWNHHCSSPCCLVATELRRKAFQRDCSRENLPNKFPSHFSYWNESSCVSLQSFLVVRDSATSQPSLLCVSDGGENEAVFDHNIKSTDTGGMAQTHADTLATLHIYFLLLCVAVCVCDELSLCHFVTSGVCSMTQSVLGHWLDQTYKYLVLLNLRAGNQILTSWLLSNGRFWFLKLWTFYQLHPLVLLFLLCRCMHYRYNDRLKRQVTILSQSIRKYHT